MFIRYSSFYGPVYGVRVGRGGFVLAEDGDGTAKCMPFYTAGHRPQIALASMWQAELLGSAFQTTIESCVAPVVCRDKVCQLAYCASTHGKHHTAATQ
jgi:hypothetical protein